MAGREIHRSGITRHCDKSLVFEGYVFGYDVFLDWHFVHIDCMLVIAFSMAPTMLLDHLVH